MKVKTWLDILTSTLGRMIYKSWAQQKHGIIKTQHDIMGARAIVYMEVVVNIIHPDRQKIGRSHSSMENCAVI